MNDAPPGDQTIASRGRRPSVFWPTVWLAVALIAVKATYVVLSPFWTWATPNDYVSWLFVRWVAGAANADLLFAAGAGCIAASLLLITRKQLRAARIIVDEQSLSMLDNSCIDYSDSLADSGFKVVNPNAARSCGCGTSFTPK